jgi:FkbM family methyltransferase
VSHPRPLPPGVNFLAERIFALPRLEPARDWKFGQWDEKDPRANVRHRLWWWAHNRGYDGPVTTSWYLGTKVNHHLAGDISFCTFVDGRYEPNEMYSIAEHLREGMTFVDVGANEGIFTLLAAAKVGPTGAVHAFEPSPREQSRLRANVDLNRFGQVVVHPMALGHEPGTATLNVAGADHPGHNTLGGFSYAETAPTAVQVQVDTLDRVVERSGLKRIDLIKIDVEGSETAVVQGAAQTLERFRPVIVIEAFEPSLEKMGSSVRELLDVIRSHRYDAGDPESLNVVCRPLP